MIKYKIVIVSILLFFFNFGFTQSGLTPEQRIDSIFSMYTLETPGVAISVVKNGKIIFKKGYGLANLEYDIPITPKTIFLVASISKQFTAYSIYLLEKQNKLSLDDDIRKYIPEVPNFGKTITIKHLLYHTSGLKEELALLSFAGWRMDEVITTEQILKLLSHQTELNFTPGSEFRYSNTGYTLLAEIVKRVSGMSFATFTKENIFIPLGMNNTHFYDDFEKLIKNRAYSYDYENNVYKKENLSDISIGGTGLYSNVEDLALWANNFENPIVGDKNLIKKFNKPATFDNGEEITAWVVDNEPINHAKGQFIRNYRGVDTYIHTGSQAAFNAYLGRFPDKGFTVITLSNDMSYASYLTSMKIAEFYLENEMTDKKVASNSSEEANDLKEEKFNTNLSEFEGKYYSEELSTNYILKIEEGNIVMTHSRLSDMVLNQIGASKFSGTNYYSFQLEFIKGEDQKVIGYNIIDFRGEKIRFVKM